MYVRVCVRVYVCAHVLIHLLFLLSLFIYLRIKIKNIQYFGSEDIFGWPSQLQMNAGLLGQDFELKLGFGFGLDQDWG